MKKIGKMNEAAWLLGTLICTLGVAFCTKANFGLSMIGAPPYALHLWLRDSFEWFTQGTAEYVWQGIILIIMCVVIRRFKAVYLLSFGTAVFAGLALDGWITLLGGNGPFEQLWVRIAALIFGELLCAAGVAFLFRTTLPIQIYELAVKEIADRFSFNINKVKLANDYLMLGLSLVLPLILFGGFGGFGIATVIMTVVNAPLIKAVGKLLDKIFVFDSLFVSERTKKTE